MITDNQIPFVTLPNWIRAATRCGFQIDPLFERFGIKPDLLHLEQATVSAEALDGLMQACVDACRLSAPDQHFPFVLGETFTFEYLPEIETYISTSANLREASQALRWVRELVNPYIDLRLAEEGRIAWIYLHHEQATNAEAFVYYAESVQPTVLKFARTLLGEKAKFRLLRFRHAPPPYAAMYESYFHIPVAFNQPWDGIEFDRELLDQPLQGAFPSLHQQAQVLVERRLAQQPRRKGMAARVQQLLIADPALLGLGIEVCAQRLEQHPRSLQRKLKSESTHFAELVDELRFRMAVEALQSDDTTLENLAEQLGFTERRSFTRAFRRWSGMSPRQYRQTLK